MIALTILALVAVNVTMVSKTGGSAVRHGSFMSMLQDDVDLTLDRVKLAVMASSADNVEPRFEAPLSSPEINYSISLGVQSGEAVMSDPERIRWEDAGPGGGRVTWTQNPALETEHTVVWSNWVPSLYQGETANGNDDNGNELSDETGLAFEVVQENLSSLEVYIHLTIERTNPDGREVPASRRVNVTCRN
jgi:hypothetical protein